MRSTALSLRCALEELLSAGGSSYLPIFDLTSFTALAAVDFAELSAFSASCRTPLSPLFFLLVRLLDPLALGEPLRLVEVRLREVLVFLLDFLEPDFLVFEAIVTSG